MQVAAILLAIPLDTVRAVLAGRARWRVRWLIGDLIDHATTLGEGLTAIARRRRKGEADAGGGANLLFVNSLLARAITWGAMLRARLHAEVASRERLPRVPASRVPDKTPPPPLPEGVPPAPDPAAEWAAVARRLRAQRARADRKALTVMLATRPVTEVLAQMCEDVALAAEEMGETPMVVKVRGVVAELGRLFGKAEDGTACEPAIDPVVAITNRPLDTVGVGLPPGPASALRPVRWPDTG